MNKIFTLFVTVFISLQSFCQPPDTLSSCRNGFNIYVLESYPSLYRFLPEKPDSLGRFHWDFGDGLYSDEQSPLHSYGVSGSYIVGFYYTSPDSCVSYVSDTVIATGFNKCSASWISYPEYVSNQPAIHGSDSVILKYVFQDLSIGNVISWYWKFGDGTFSTEQNPVHEYDSTGIFSVCLEILTSDTCSSTFCSEIFIQASNECNYTGTVRDYTGLDGCGLVIELDNGTVLEPVEIVPNFLIYAGQRVKLSYTELKDRASVCMTGIIARIDCISAIEVDSCNAAFTWYSLPWVSSVPPIYQFEIINPHRNITASTWDFGDGTAGTGFTITHRFPRDGYFTVCLTVETLGGCVVTYCEPAWFDGYDSDPGLCNAYIKLLTDIILNGHSCNGSATAALVDDYGNNVPASDYLWSTGESGPVIYNLCPGSLYSVIVTDMSGCAVSGSFSFGGAVTYPDSLIGYWNYEQNDRDFRFTVPVYSDSVYCEWDFGDGEKAVGSAVNHSYDESTYYTVSLNVKDLEGNLLYNQIIRVASGEALGTKQDNEEKLRIYPVPVTDRLFVEHGSLQIDRIEISNTNGQLMKVEKDLNDETGTIEVNVNDLPEGLYIGRTFYRNDLNQAFKFVK